MTGVVVREYAPADLRRLLALEEEAFDEEAWPADLFRYYASAFPDLFLVARADARLAGYCIGRRRTSTAGEIDSVAVFRKYRRHGIGRILMRELLRRFRRHGVRDVGLMVRPDNTAALPFYERLGFVHRRTIPRYYADGSRAWRLVRKVDYSLR